MTTILLTLFLACDPEPAAADPVTQAAAVARAILADPSTAETALADNGLTRSEFEALMYEIAADPEKSAAYRDALGQ